MAKCGEGTVEVVGGEVVSVGRVLVGMEPGLVGSGNYGWGESLVLNGRWDVMEVFIQQGYIGTPTGPEMYWRFALATDKPSSTADMDAAEAVFGGLLLSWIDEPRFAVVTPVNWLRFEGPFRIDPDGRRMIAEMGNGIGISVYGSVVMTMRRVG